MSKDLEKMMKNAQDANDGVKKRTEKKSMKSIIIIAIVAVVAVVGLLIYGGTKNKQAEVDGGAHIDTSYVETSEIVAKYNFPANVPRWARTVYDEKFLENKDRMAEMMEWAEQTEVGYALSGIPSSKEHDDTPGFTNDLDKEYNEDGTFNEYYSYILKEDYLKTYAIALQRFINPNFGDWESASIDDEFARGNITPSLFHDISSGDLFKKAEDAPVFSNINGRYDKYDFLVATEEDENALTYGMFYGEIDDEVGRMTEVEYVTSETSDESEVIIDTPVVLKAFGKGGKIIEVKANIKMVLVENDDNESPFRAIVKSASMEVKE